MQETTLETVLIDLLMNNTDRGVLVRRTSHGKQPSVIVLLLTDEAVCDLGVALLPIVEELGDAPVGELLTVQMHISRMCDICDASPRHWLFFKLPFGKIEVVGFQFSGAALCARIAEICNAHECPCSLDDRPAPGFEIERVVRR